MKSLFVAFALMVSSLTAGAADMSHGANNFYQSEQVSLERVTFKNQFQMTTVGNLYLPTKQSVNAKHPAIIVGHPMGAVKEQSSNLYAQKLAEPVSYTHLTLPTSDLV